MTGHLSRRLHYFACEMIEENDGEQDSQEFGAHLVPNRPRRCGPFTAAGHTKNIHGVLPGASRCQCGKHSGIDRTPYE